MLFDFFSNRLLAVSLIRRRFFGITLGEDVGNKVFLRKLCFGADTNENDDDDDSRVECSSSSSSPCTSSSPCSLDTFACERSLREIIRCCRGGEPPSALACCSRETFFALLLAIKDSEKVFLIELRRFLSTLLAFVTESISLRSTDCVLDRVRYAIDDDCGFCCCCCCGKEAILFEFELVVVSDDEVYEDEVELEKFLRRRLDRLLAITAGIVSSSSVSSSVVLLPFVFKRIFNRRFRGCELLLLLDD
jgi:hypothetical protein